MQISHVKNQHFHLADLNIDVGQLFFNALKRLTKNQTEVVDTPIEAIYEPVDASAEPQLHEDFQPHGQTKVALVALLIAGMSAGSAWYNAVSSGTGQSLWDNLATTSLLGQWLSSAEQIQSEVNTAANSMGLPSDNSQAADSSQITDSSTATALELEISDLSALAAPAFGRASMPTEQHLPLTDGVTLSPFIDDVGVIGVTEVVGHSELAESAPFTNPVALSVDRWAKAWSSRDVSGYLNYYSKDFQPQASVSFDRWLAQRHLRFANFDAIDVALVGVQLTYLGADNAQANFIQVYSEEGKPSNVARKQLDLVLENGNWLIQREIIL